jgi:hypothetical protein
VVAVGAAVVVMVPAGTRGPEGPFLSCATDGVTVVAGQPATGAGRDPQVP